MEAKIYNRRKNSQLKSNPKPSLRVLIMTFNYQNATICLISVVINHKEERQRAHQ